MLSTDLNQDVEFLKDVVNGLQQQHRHLSGGMTSPSSTSLEPKEDMQQEKTGGN